mmetsp:Transcript_46460/g.138875  ORF Transcript_46460/g.138875 Transcript_46460/m.138875 type:complete len:429 (-) Transcript_46460:863-2149(-)
MQQSRDLCGSGLGFVLHCCRRSGPGCIRCPCRRVCLCPRPCRACPEGFHTCLCRGLCGCDLCNIGTGCILPRHWRLPRHGLCRCSLACLHSGSHDLWCKGPRMDVLVQLAAWRFNICCHVLGPQGLGRQAVPGRSVCREGPCQRDLCCHALRRPCLQFPLRDRLRRLLKYLWHLEPPRIQLRRRGPCHCLGLWQHGLCRHNLCCVCLCGLGVCACLRCRGGLGSLGLRRRRSLSRLALCCPGGQRLGLQHLNLQRLNLGRTTFCDLPRLSLRRNDLHSRAPSSCDRLLGGLSPCGSSDQSLGDNAHMDVCLRHRRHIGHCLGCSELAASIRSRDHQAGGLLRDPGHGGDCSGRGGPGSRGPGCGCHRARRLRSCCCSGRLAHERLHGFAGFRPHLMDVLRLSGWTAAGTGWCATTPDGLHQEGVLCLQ